MRVIRRTRRGARILGGGDVVSEILRQPGPTHTLFDVLAACVAGLSPGPRIAVLGFGGGGIMAPLRAMGFAHPVQAVDVWKGGARLFRELSGEWAGEVRIAAVDAVRWIGGSRRLFDLVLEDLTVPVAGNEAKPAPSFEDLPRLIRGRLAPAGVFVLNALRPSGASWSGLRGAVTRVFRRVLELGFEDYHNRLWICGRRLPPAGAAPRAVRAARRPIGARPAVRVAGRPPTP
ncbi:MAG: hypothetical protein ACE5JG_03835 [Planctomycetota bacterium]